MAAYEVVEKNGAAGGAGHVAGEVEVGKDTVNAEAVGFGGDEVGPSVVAGIEAAAAYADVGFADGLDEVVLFEEDGDPGVGDGFADDAGDFLRAVGNVFAAEVLPCDPVGVGVGAVFAWGFGPADSAEVALLPVGPGGAGPGVVTGYVAFKEVEEKGDQRRNTGWSLPSSPRTRR